MTCLAKQNNTQVGIGGYVFDAVLTNKQLLVLLIHVHDNIIITLNNFKLASLIVTMLINRRIQTIYNYSLLRTPVTIVHSRMQNDKCEYLNIYITIKHFRNNNEI